MLRPLHKLELFLAAALICLAPAFAHGQSYLYATGTPTFTTQWPDQLGFINVSNGNIHIEIPLAQHAQRGSLHLNERLVYDSRIWQIADSSSYQWEPTNVAHSMGGWRLVAGNEGGAMTSLLYIQSGTCGPRRTDSCVETYTFQWTDPGGTEHTFIGPTVDRTLPRCSSNCPTAITSAIDASGYQLQYTNLSSSANATAVFDPNGTRIYPSVQDANGNAWTKDSNGNLVDTLGRTPLKTTVNGDQIYYDVLTYGGGTSRYTVTTESVNVKTAFNEEAVSEFTGTFTAIQSIELPDGTSFQFSYDSGTSSGNYGELTGVTLPTGGTISYGYSNYFDSYQNVNRWPTSRTDSAGTTTFTPAVVTQCSSGGTGCVEQMTVTRPDHNDVVYLLTLNNGSWNTQTDEWSGSSTSGGTKLRTTLPTYDYTHACSIPNACTGAQYISKTAETSTLWDAAGGAVAKQTQFVTNLAVGKLSSVKEWDYYPVSSGPPSTPARQTAYTYDYHVNGAGLLTQTTVSDGSGNQVSQTTIGYDETTGTGHAALTPTSGLPNHNATVGNRGNLTTTAQWLNTTGGTLSTTATYDDAGALLGSTDPNGTTTYGYDGTDTYTTGVTPPTPSSGVPLPNSATYDSSTGLPLTATDPNGTQTAYKNYDAFGRAGEVDITDSSANMVGKTMPSYKPAQLSGYGTPLSIVQNYQNASQYGETDILYNGYGRISRTAVSNGQSGNSWYQQDTCYDVNGRVNFKSYAYQGTGFNQAIVCSGAGDTYLYDALGRVKSITHSDGTAITYNYTGRATQITDENGVSRITQVDALGRITVVCEVSSANVVGTGPGSCVTDMPNMTGYRTTYGYTTDSSGNQVTTIIQGSQQRTFTTDSVGRTVSTSEPERGTTNYSYAQSTATGLGLTVARTRPQANQTNPSTLTTTTTQYDLLGRPVTVTYSDGTPQRNFAYDQAYAWGGTVSLGSSKGRLTQQSAAAAGNWTGSAYGYDPMGRVNWEDQCQPSGCGTTAHDKFLNFQYDWLGNLRSSNDGSAIITSDTYSVANEITSITSTANDSTNPPHLVSDVQNGPNGPISYNLGNGLSQFNAYDAQGRLDAGWVCAGAPSYACPAQRYGYVVKWSGNRIASSSDDVMGSGTTYAYDNFNRLASTNIGNGTQAFTYSYDRYGNRWRQTVTSGSGPQPSYTFNYNNNQITAAGYTYDAVGNMTSDSFHTYTYDAEGNVTQVDRGATAIYSYNALNQRVRIDKGATAIEFVFNLNGQRTSEWDGHSSAQLRGQHYMGARPLAYYDSSTHFQHLDYLGTARVQTSYNGTGEGAYSSLPFGDAFSDTNGAAQFYGNGSSDDDAYHFAALDHDSETDTDHAQFRNYSPTQGRWLTPDPYSGSYDLTNPQSLNRFTYLGNNPLTFTDPSGQFTNGATGEGGGCDLLCDVITLGVGGLIDGLEALFGGGPSFHGALTPRPQSTGVPDWGDDPGSFGESLGIGSNLKTGSWGIAPALGLPDAGCEFGACGGGVGSFQQGATTADDWCVQNPVLCGAIGAAAAPIVLPFLASAALLSLEGDNSSGKWTCTASCNLQGIGKNEPPMSRVTGTASGTNEANACLSAKRVATQSAPPGTYARHCQCSCSKR